MMKDVRASWDGVTTLALMAGALAAINLEAGVMSANGMAPVSVVLVAQALTGALAAYAARYMQDGRPRALAAHLALWLAVAGALGVIAWCALVVADGVRRSHEAPFAVAIDAEIDDDPLEALAATAGAIRDGRVRLEGASATMPLRDVLAGAPIAARLRALSALARNYDPAMAHALSMALASKEASVRVLAATALAKLHHQYTTRIDAAAIHVRPDAPESNIALAHARLDFAMSGLLNGERRTMTLQLAEEAFKTAFAIDGALESARTGAVICRRAIQSRPRLSFSPRPRAPSALAPTGSLQ